jgi:hypothetical protein
MEYTLENIKSDLQNLDVRQFYMKYIVKSDNWYFRNILGISDVDIIYAVDEFRDIVSSNIGVSFNSVMMVGSGKTGYSLSPRKDFKLFEKDTDSKNKSDIDIAIISNNFYEMFWGLFRRSYNVKYENIYTHVFREIYRGYINERNLVEIENCRKAWSEVSVKSTKLLRSKLYLKHDITYRIYRSWEDFEEYNISSLKKMKGKV